MEKFFFSNHFDLATPDGMIVKFDRKEEEFAKVLVHIYNISPLFVGFKIDPEFVFFNLKSTLAQIGLNGIGVEYHLDAKTTTAEIKVELKTIGHLGKKMLHLLSEGAYIGKLFAADPRRRVRNPDYLFRMFGRTDTQGLPLLSLGGMQGSQDLLLEKVDGHTVAFLPLQEGVLQYEPSIEGFLPTLAQALLHQEIKTRHLLQLHQKWCAGFEKKAKEDEILLVRTLPLHIRTVFGRVVDELLPQGFHHTSASVLEPDTRASGDIYELFGSSDQDLQDIPLEFYTLEPHREHVFFADRDQLQASLENPDTLYRAFETAPGSNKVRAATFVFKGEQLLSLSSRDWNAKEVQMNEFPGLIHPGRQAQMVQRYIEQQPSYPFLKGIQNGIITSQGILLTKHFPSPLMKKLLLSDLVQNCLKRIYFQYPSQSYEDFFSHEDRSMLLDLAKFAIPTYWVDKTSGKILQFVPKPDKDSGMFVPVHQVDTFLKATYFGVYGSNLIEGNFEEQLIQLLEGIKAMRKDFAHPLLHKDTPLALVTGGGPGVMEVGNRVARNLAILSCANIVDFRNGKIPNEQRQNAYIDAKMTYRLDKLVERQAEFYLDFPIFLTGGIGTDFEYALEEVRRKVGPGSPTPILLFGTADYWKQKVSSRFKCNLREGTISGSEWVSNCFYCVQTASQGLKVYRQFFQGTLPIGKSHPTQSNGFCIVP
ncbi:MAG: hypothetical protein L0207_05045 [Chlamydiae bacterium]|nr:hypothetical protein [Chlamydiota bacterium]